MSILSAALIALCLMMSARMAARAHSSASVAPLGKAVMAALAAVGLGIVYFAFQAGTLFEAIITAPVDAKQIALAEGIAAAMPPAALGILGGGAMLGLSAWLKVKHRNRT